MTTPILPQHAAEAEALWTERDRRVAALNARQAAAVLAACHDAELRAAHPGHLAEAHDVDVLDGAFAVLAPGYPTVVTA